MYNYEIRNLCAHVNNFLGVFARDKIPIIKNYPSFLVVNTDKSTEKGKHWVAFRVDSRKCEYFDSFGLPPMYPEMHSLFKEKKLVWNTKQLQHLESRGCGAFCVAFVIDRATNTSFKSFLAKFSKFHKCNDNLAWKIIDDGYKTNQNGPEVDSKRKRLLRIQN